MSAVNVTSVQVSNNPAPFLAPLAFEIEYECLTALADDLEWKMTYVGSAENEGYDQLLDSVLVGPVSAGTYRFIFEGNAPDPARLPPDDVLGVTVILLTCSYHDTEFIRIGYYVNVEYTEEELRENPPEVPVVERLWRTILAEHPRVTRFAIPFDNPEVAGTSEEAAGTAVQDGFGGAALQHGGGGAGHQAVGDDAAMQDADMDQQAGGGAGGGTPHEFPAFGKSSQQLSGPYCGGGQQQPEAPPQPGLADEMQYDVDVGAF